MRLKGMPQNVRARQKKDNKSVIFSSENRDEEGKKKVPASCGAFTIFFYKIIFRDNFMGSLLFKKNLKNLILNEKRFFLLQLR